MEEKRELCRKILKRISDDEKMNVINYAELCMSGNPDAKALICKMFWECENLADYDIIMSEAYRALSPAAQIRVDNDNLRALECNPPLLSDPRKVLNKLAVLRIDSGYTQRELSEKSGVNIRQIQKYESGVCEMENMTLRNALAISEVLGCDVKDFL